MAQVKYGTIVTELKGKVGGNVFQGGYGGPQFKPKKKPKISFSGTDHWMSVGRKKKSALALVSQSWRGLHEGDRLTWAAMAPSYPATNRFGDTYTPSGYQLFMQCNIIQIYRNLAIVETAPAPYTYPDIAASTISECTATTITLTLPDSIEATERIEVLATASISPGAASARGGFKLLGSYACTVGTDIALIDDYSINFGAPKVGQNIIFKIRPIANGEVVKKLWGYIRSEVV